jgi:hypothetical protein
MQKLENEFKQQESKCIQDLTEKEQRIREIENNLRNQTEECTRKLKLAEDIKKKGDKIEDIDQQIRLLEQKKEDIGIQKKYNEIKMKVDTNRTDELENLNRSYTSDIAKVELNRVTQLSETFNKFNKKIKNMENDRNKKLLKAKENSNSYYQKQKIPLMRSLRRT